MKELFYKKMNQIMKKALLAIALIQLFAIPLFAMEEDKKAEDYLHISKLWGALKFLHPKVISREIDWNSVFIETIASMEKGEMNLSEGIDNLLNRLDDIHTFVTEDNFFSPNDSTAVNTLEMKNRILYLRLNDYSTFQEEKTDSLMQKAIEYSQNAKGIVLDLRHLNGNWFELNTLLQKHNLIEQLVVGDLELPFTQHVSYQGYPNEKYYTGHYKARFLKERTQDFVEGVRKNKEIPIVVIINKSTVLPVSLVALSLNGKAYFITVDKQVYFSGFPLFINEQNIYIQTTWKSLDENNFKTYIHEILDSSLTEKELFELAKKRLKTKTHLPCFDKPFLQHIKDDFQTKNEYPDKYERILALAKLYNVMQFFSPHKNLMKVIPEENFKHVFPEMIAAKDSLEYNYTLAKFLHNVADSHAWTEGSSFMKRFLTGSFPIDMKKMDDTFIISKIYDENWIKEKNISVGDEILAIDGKSLKSIFDETKLYFSRSNQNGENYYVTRMILNGDLEKNANLTINKNNVIDDIIVQRIPYKEKRSMEFAIKDTIRFYENIAYVNLAWLPREKIKEMFSEIKDSEALIFDMRGYPKGIMWELSKYLSDEKTLYSHAQIPIFDFTYFYLNENRMYAQKSFAFGTGKRYLKPIVVLMDESTQSQAEGTCSMIKELTSATLIGRQTSGADGDVTYVALPGNVYVSFTGMDAMNARQISEQGIGLLPDIEVEYTLEGIREERDEILEKALKYLRNRLENEK